MASDYTGNVCWFSRRKMAWIYGNRKLLLARIEKAKLLLADWDRRAEEIYQWELANPELFKQCPWYANRLPYHEAYARGERFYPTLNELVWLLQWNKDNMPGKKLGQIWRGGSDLSKSKNKKWIEREKKIRAEKKLQKGQNF